ncbi:hypothetical protein [uncultured Parasutterella sp.]|uniref:hypothetical protein n=2 Tax=uncultured Parasutterella sp. TaxID=1263098 RepID=UPI0025939E93|nr:hypothetical protein [uncultured Parasutterella sp.]
MLNNPALLLFRSFDEDQLHFIAGTSKVNFRLSSNELDCYRVYVNGSKTTQQLNSLTWKANDRIKIVKRKGFGAWYNVLQDPDWDPEAVPDIKGSQLPIKLAYLEPKHWLSPLPNFLPDEKYIGVLRTFVDCTALETVCDYLFSNMPHTNNLARVFQGCTSLKTVPEHIFDGIWENLISPSSVFVDSGLTEVPVLFYHNSYPSCINVGEMFENAPIKNVPLSFFDKFTQLERAQHLYSGTRYLESCPIALFSKNTNIKWIYRLFMGSKMLSKPGVVLDFSNCPNIEQIDNFWGDPADTSIPISPCTVKVRRSTPTAALFADKKANSSYKDTFNIQYA